MSTTTTENKSFEITKGINGLEKVILRETHGSSVEVYLYGAHVTSWKNEHNEEMLFVSSKYFVCIFIDTKLGMIEVRVEGLETLDYLDNTKNRERYTEQGDAITFESEIDKIYLSTPTKIAVLDHEKKRTFVIRKEGLPDAVVWNPWDKKAKTMADFGDEEYKQMLCVEAAAIEKPVTLKPGEEWKVRLELSAVPSSYFSGQLDPKKVLQGA
ncbi:hypothetical protein CTI12_AA326890 [Artemisia annua]|uniref:Glucose-6-phosphate 1-epimerase n=1 Tax=Artemisia annua TaxID=35608 RepID=A0A2U1LYP1_ARTAN|nr:hypothetical protein CTI12_AA326890 [Artemisia annua]